MKGIFLIGAAGYPLLEILYRGRTHYSMAIAGGCGTVLIAMISRTELPLLIKAVICGTGITGIEFICGCIWNRSYAVWDYRKMPMNVLGQICLPYTLLWCGLSSAVMTGYSIYAKGRM